MADFYAITLEFNDPDAALMALAYIGESDAPVTPSGASLRVVGDRGEAKAHFVLWEDYAPALARLSRDAREAYARELGESDA